MTADNGREPAIVVVVIRGRPNHNAKMTTYPTERKTVGGINVMQCAGVTIVECKWSPLIFYRHPTFGDIIW